VLAVAVVCIGAIGLAACLLVQRRGRSPAGKAHAPGRLGWRRQRRKGSAAPLQFEKGPSSPGLPDGGFGTPHPQLDSPCPDELLSPATLLGGAGAGPLSSQGGGAWTGPRQEGPLGMEPAGARIGAPAAAAEAGTPEPSISAPKACEDSGVGGAFLADLERSGGTPRMHSARLRRAAQLYRDGALSHEEFQSVHARICAAASSRVKADLASGQWGGQEGGEAAAAAATTAVVERDETGSQFDGSDSDSQSGQSDGECNFSIRPEEIRDLESHALQMCKLLRLCPEGEPGKWAGVKDKERVCETTAPAEEVAQAQRPALSDAKSRLNQAQPVSGAQGEQNELKKESAPDVDKLVALRTLRSIYSSVAALAHSPGGQDARREPLQAGAGDLLPAAAAAAGVQGTFFPR